MDPFKYIKENLDIEDVAQRYGLEVKNHKSLCIFHEENTASLSFKFNRFYCLGCGIKGSSIDIVMKLFSLEPLEAVKKINNDYQLGLDLDPFKTGNKGEIQARIEDKNLEKAFCDWVNKTSSTYAKLARYYWQNIKQYRPQSEGEEFNPKYIEAVQQLPRIEYISDILLKGTIEEKAGLYRSLNNLGGE